MGQVVITVGVENKTMKTNNRIAILFCMMMAGCCFASGMAVRNAISNLVSFCAESDMDDARSINEWGFSFAVRRTSTFTNACAVVLNNWQYAMDDWAYYATNSEARLFFKNLCGFAGTNTLIGVWNRMLDISSANTNACTPMTVMELHDAPATPLEDFVMLHYDNPTISNCLMRTRLLFPAGSDERSYYDMVLSGEQKREWELERSVRQSK